MRSIHRRSQEKAEPTEPPHLHFPGVATATSFLTQLLAGDPIGPEDVRIF